MSKLGGLTLFAAEAALWVAGAAIVAGMAGAHWDVEMPLDMGSLTGSTPAPSVSTSPSASPSPTVALQTLASGASPTISPIVAKYQAYVARADYQFKAKYTSVATLILNGSPFESDEDGTMSYLAGDYSRNTRQTVSGAVTTIGEVAIGSADYQSVNGAAWTKSVRSANDAANSRLTFAPVALFVDKGVETENSRQLHRLDIADPVAYSKAMVKATDGATGCQVTYSVWVDDNGVPQAIKLSGWVQEPVRGVSTKITEDEEFRVIATSGVTITAPI